MDNKYLKNYDPEASEFELRSKLPDLKEQLKRLEEARKVRYETLMQEVVI